MVKFLLASLVLMPVFSMASVNAEVKVSKVLDLEMMELYDTHLVHAGRVWEGKIRTGKVQTPSIEVFTLDGKPEAHVELGYSPTHIFPNGSDSVMVTGHIMGEHFSTPFTKITLKNGKYVAKTTNLGEETHIEHFVGDGKREIFSRFADRGILGNFKGGYTPVNTEEVVGPHHLILFDDRVYVLNLHNISGVGHETISRVDFATGKVKIVSGKNYLGGATSLYFHQPSGLVVFPEVLLERVTLFDPKTEKAVGSLSVKNARGFATLGHCLAVASEDERIVSFFDLTKSDRPLVSTWDLASAGPTFKKARNIGIDEKSGKLFARSTYPCTQCMGTMSSVVMAEEPSQATRNACLEAMLK